MSKRIYSARNKRIYRYRPGGNWYMRQGDSELCLETADDIQAEANLKYQDALTKRYGAASFRFRVKDLFPKFLSEKKRMLRDNTYRGYEKLWNGYIGFSLGKLYLADVNQKAWDKYCGTHTSVADFQNHKALVHQFLVWCARKGFLLSLPIFGNPDHKRRRRKIIPPDHLTMIFQRANGNLLLFISMALFMGMRRAEIMKLEWSRADLDGRSLLLRDEDVKTDEGRHIPLNSAVHRLLIDRLKAHQENGIRSPWVFPNLASSKRHADVGGLMTAWRRCLLHCGFAEQVFTTGNKSKYKIVVEYTFHDLRATYEKYSHTAQGFTDTQREKMVGADIEVQRRLYVTMGADDLRGMEEVVTNQLLALPQIIAQKTVAQLVEGGNEVGAPDSVRKINGVSHE